MRAHDIGSKYDTYDTGDDDMTKFASGQPVTRLEDQALLEGRGRYADDVRADRAAHMAVLRSPHAHARLPGIDTGAASRAPGVLTVLTGRDVASDGLGDIPCLMPLQNVDGSSRADTPRPLLALDRVRHVGDPVAIVVAESLALARDAAELIEVEYEPLAAVVDAQAATGPAAPRIWDHVSGNLCFDWEQGDRRATDRAFAAAAHVSRVRVVNNRLVANPMEPRAAIAEYDAASDRSTLTTPTQGPHLIHGQIADAILKIDKAKLRVISGNVGGAFGMKIFLHPEQPLAVWASRRLKRSVRWTGDRSESFLSDAQGRDNISLAELAMDRDGRFLALRVTTWANLGAYLSNFAPFIPTGAGTAMLAGVYRTPAIHVSVKGVLTNTVPVDAYRGAGRPEAIYLLERLIDVAARELKISPEEIRARNFIGPQDMPFSTALGTVYDSGEFEAAMRRCMEKAGWAGFSARRSASAARGRLRGIGLAMYIERCGGGNADIVTLRVDERGGATLYSGMQDNGQGHMTTFVQLLSERLEIDAARIRVVQGDTDLVGAGLTGGSRFLAVGGAAAIGAADEVIDKGAEIAALSLEVARADIEYREGMFCIAGTDRSMSLAEVAGASRSGATLPAGMSQGLEATYARTPQAPTYPNGCHIVELEIEPDTGAVTLERYTIVDDLGRAMNPLLAAGQVHGGTVQGVGQALLEHALYDSGSGQLLSGSFMDYAMPRADNVPAFDCEFRNVPCTTNPLGVKGAGEAGAVGAPAAVINAIVDALHGAAGTVHLDMPATPEKIWRELARPHGRN